MLPCPSFERGILIGPYVSLQKNKGIRRRLADAAGVDSEGLQLKATRPADALLIMSGSHPLRRLPLLKRAFLDVNDGIKLASSMRDRSVGVPLWMSGALHSAAIVCPSTMFLLSMTFVSNVFLYLPNPAMQGAAAECSGRAALQAGDFCTRFVICVNSSG